MISFLPCPAQVHTPPQPFESPAVYLFVFFGWFWLLLINLAAKVGFVKFADYQTAKGAHVDHGQPKVRLFLHVQFPTVVVNMLPSTRVLLSAVKGMPIDERLRVSQYGLWVSNEPTSLGS